MICESDPVAQALALARTTVLEAIRSRVLWTALGMVAMTLGLGAFLNRVALTEQGDIQSAIAAALLRAGGSFLVASFVISSMVREASDKVIELILSQPNHRAVYVLGKLLGHACVAVTTAILLSLPLLLFAPALHVMAWGTSLACELLIVAAVSLFCVLSLTQTVAAFAATAGFYVLARSMDALRAISSSQLAGEPGWTDALVRHIFDGIALLVPSLDHMTSSAWLVESPPSPGLLASILGQSAVFVALIATAALFDLYRKNL
jgi:hypothetical protein